MINENAFCRVCGQFVRVPEEQLTHQLCNMCWNLNRALPQDPKKFDATIERVKQYRAEFKK